MAVNFDYSKTIQQAKELDTLAGDITSKAIKRLDDTAATIEAAWTGQNGAAYLKYIRLVKENLADKAKYLRAAAESLRKAAKTMKDADAKAKAASAKI